MQGNLSKSGGQAAVCVEHLTRVEGKGAVCLFAFEDAEVGRGEEREGRAAICCPSGFQIPASLFSDKQWNGMEQDHEKGQPCFYYDMIGTRTHDFAVAFCRIPSIS